MKAAKIMDLYSDFLMTSPNIVSALLLESVLDKKYSHDSITRMLVQKELSQKEYWSKVKPLIRQVESASEGIIAIDDTIEEKPHSGENELISWHHDHSKKGKYKMNKGIQILTFTYVSPQKEGKIQLPIAFDLVRKDVIYEDDQVGWVKMIKMYMLYCAWSNPDKRWLCGCFFPPTNQISTPIWDNGNLSLLYKY